MRSWIKRADYYESCKAMDNIHAPSIYEMKPGESVYIEVDTFHNVHELLNLGARQKALIEDTINTEKNRGYHYEHAFSYDWNAAQGFHYLMRLGHAINALSELTKTLKRYVKNLGVGATLKLIQSTLFSPWLSLTWYDKQLLQTPQLRLQLE